MTWQYFTKKLSYIFFDKSLDISLFNIRYLPRWMVVIMDVIMASISIFLTYLVIREITTFLFPVMNLQQLAMIILCVHIVYFFVFRTYAGVIRHSTFVDIIKIAFACTCAMVTLMAINYTYKAVYGQKLFLFAFLLVNMAVTFTAMLSLRVIVKTVYLLFQNAVIKPHTRLLILGVNDDTIAIGEAMKMSVSNTFDLVGFISLTKTYGNLKILETPVFKLGENLFKRVEHLDVNGVLIVGNQLNIQDKNNFVDLCLNNQIKIYNAPVIKEWNEDTQIGSNIHKIQIEDLLERNAINLDDELIQQFIDGRTILVTGGAGSIGSEIVRQIAAYNPAKIVVFDQAESPLHDLEMELTYVYPNLDIVFILGDIRDVTRLNQLFSATKFDVVYHAAAYKHVPLIERNPREAVQVNILGTMGLADCAVKYKVKTFVMVSTDKAVNPTNVMGASKRAAEIYVQSLQEHASTTCFITTRFGNVLGSNGSVIPHFKKQIAYGGPVTVTHLDINRFFMTIPEACQLVLQAGTMGKGGEVFVFDMGKPVRIMDLAERMIRLSGLKPYEDIDIEITGLRPGEKLYEELLIDETKTLPTPHKKIMIAKDEVMPYYKVLDFILDIKNASDTNGEERMVGAIKALVPEFISKNSVFEILDK